MLLVLIVPTVDRHWQAWLIFLPLGLVLLIWRMPLMLLGQSDESTEKLGDFVVAMAMGVDDGLAPWASA